MRGASKEEAALLLCGLLLGFGLDAWVCLGRLGSGVVHIWVMTRGVLAAPTIWEPFTGIQYGPEDAPAWPYYSLSCVFNHQRLYANQQADDTLSSTSLLFEEPGLWRELSVGPKEVAGPAWAPVELRPPAHDAARAMEPVIEQHLRRELSAWRARAMEVAHEEWQPQREGHMVWDEGLEHLLTAALVAYEHEAVTGTVAPGVADFQAAIKRCVSLGSVFRGVPHQHRHADAIALTAALLADTQVLDMLCVSPQLEPTFAIRVRCFAYPEGLMSVWLMLAVRHNGSTNAMQRPG